jgi:hypothetical protein
MRKEKAIAQKNTLLKNAQANAKGNFFKRVFFSPTQEEIQIIFFPTLRFFNYFFYQRTVFNRAAITSYVNRFEESVCGLQKTPIGADRRASANTGLAKVAVQCCVDTFVVIQSLVLRINICGENRHCAKRQTVSDNY